MEKKRLLDYVLWKLFFGKAERKILVIAVMIIGAVSTLILLLTIKSLAVQEERQAVVLADQAQLLFDTLHHNIQIELNPVVEYARLLGGKHTIIRRTAPESLALELETEFEEQYNFRYSRTLITDVGGVIIASTYQESVLPAEEKWWLEAREVESSPWVMASTNRQNLILASRIVDSEGNFMGVFKTEVALETVIEYLHTYLSSNNYPSLTYILLNKDLKILYSSNDNFNVKAPLYLVERLLNLDQGTPQEKYGKDEEGQEHIVIPTMLKDKNTELILVLDLKREDLIGYLNKQLAILLISSGLFVLLLVIAPFQLARSLLQQINSLQETIEEVKHGNLKVRAPDLLQGELEKLSRSLNDMIKGLADIEHLEQITEVINKVNLKKSQKSLVLLQNDLQYLMNNPSASSGRSSRKILASINRHVQELGVNLATIQRHFQDIGEPLQVADLTKIITEIIKERNQMATGKKITFKTKVKNVPGIAMDSTLFEQIARSLIREAIIHSPPKSTIHVRAKKRSESVVMAVSYQRGINNLKAKVDREERGERLDLSTCKQIAESHGGKIIRKKSHSENVLCLIVPLQNKIKTRPLTAQNYIEEELKPIFIEKLGPLAMTELRQVGKNASERKLLHHLQTLQEQGIMNKQVTSDFKEKVHAIYKKVKRHERHTEESL